MGPTDNDIDWSLTSWEGQPACTVAPVARAHGSRAAAGDRGDGRAVSADRGLTAIERA